VYSWQLPESNSSISEHYLSVLLPPAFATTFLAQKDV
jgi:hypothetical protein